MSWLKILRIVGGGFIRPSMRLGVRVNSHLATTTAPNDEELGA